ncbi:MAG: flagellar biosynthetic protein FliQ [Zetaproteobacteria bacterium CG06_land_8_20_14_3_00_59_53]|nr:MAG: EscS/YscS/HrcS family type III secretion system export apparatus protein [Zetaproteobacteria bacterium CG2_30_59_37]PIO88776.1 MAG: flagellar biosynthetic protein FliQ [Zetaproteobacteria bacterium CG23_combo_of_CG06-09_8_20_14_all_59_86]PIQ65405.1 MAG: flagellar biosynthetic protein FliQ [Zetaproteobacteria bacterium CG11_big_fil_rev_8_21_14_0_20_59_439]PIU69657.1 MAG: flagellar biosynthetic protein FliQ [Zetaproteobacteria bacterium CG06_land_8_20_14_3_00_59_53]PIU97062.1 MAG: flagell
MNPDTVIHIGTDALRMVLLLSLPMLLVALVVGVAISLFQAVTQIQEMTLTFVPKIIAVFGSMVLAAPWLTKTMVEFTRNLIESIPGLLR